MSPLIIEGVAEIQGIFSNWKVDAIIESDTMGCDTRCDSSTRLELYAAQACLSVPTS